MKKTLWLLFFLALCICIAALANHANDYTIDTWYPTLYKPPLNPPDWVFGLVWPILYLLIAISGWLIFIQKQSADRTKALFFYGLQLFCNGVWSYLFFYYKMPILGLIDLILLVIFLAICMGYAYKKIPAATYLLVPYFLWSLFALYLNGAIVYRS